MQLPLSACVCVLSAASSSSSRASSSHTASLHQCSAAYAEDVTLNTTENATHCSLNIRVAKRSDELRAIGATRAASFHSYPEDRSSDAVERHAKMNADEQWKSVENKIKLQDPGFRGVLVTALLASLAPPSKDTDTAAVQAALENVANDMLSGGAFLPSKELVVGSLDINVCKAMPGEGLSGMSGKKPYTRCYLSNVCVVQSARGLGIGRRLIHSSLEEAKKQGIEAAYVHCGQSNNAAYALYTKCGFVEEKRDDARKMEGTGYEPRILFRYDLNGQTAE